MIGGFAALGQPGGSAVVGVLACRAISFWIHTIPGYRGATSSRTPTVHEWRAADREGADE